MVEDSLGDVYIAKDPMLLCFIAHRGAYLEIQFVEVFIISSCKELDVRSWV
jgi:hypothetical protein